MDVKCKSLGKGKCQSGFAENCESVWPSGKANKTTNKNIKSEIIITASVLEEDPNTYKVKKNAIY